MSMIIRRKGGATVALRRRSPPAAARTPIVFDSVQVFTGAYPSDTEMTLDVPGHNHLFDARGATFVHDPSRSKWPAQIRTRRYGNAYWYGGLMRRNASESWTWQQSYRRGSLSNSKTKTAGIALSGSSSNGVITFDSVRMHHVHDGVMSGQASSMDKIVITKNCYMTHLYDDAVENPNWHNMIVQENLIDGAGIFYAPREGGSSERDRRDSHRLVVIRDNVVWLKRFYDLGDRGDWGHGQVYKAEGPRGFAHYNVWINNVFVVDDPHTQARAHRAFDPRCMVYARNNVIVWAGSGSFPSAWLDDLRSWGALDTQVRVVDWRNGGEAIFTAAKAAWLAKHKYDDATAGGSNGGGVIASKETLDGPYHDRIMVLGGSGTARCEHGIDILVGASDGDDGRGGESHLIGDGNENFIYGGPGGPNLLDAGPAGRTFLVGGEHSIYNDGRDPDDQIAPRRNTFVLRSRTDGTLQYVLGFEATDKLALTGVLEGYDHARADSFVRFVDDAGVESTGTMPSPGVWLEVRRNGAGSWLRLAWIASGLGLTPAKLGSRLVIA